MACPCPRICNKGFVEDMHSLSDREALDRFCNGSSVFENSVYRKCFIWKAQC